MNMAWDKFQKEAEKIEVRDPVTAKQKMQKLQLAMNLRRRLRERFHTRGVDTPDYTKWIAKVETDTRQLADALLSMFPHFIRSNRHTQCGPRLCGRYCSLFIGLALRDSLPIKRLRQEVMLMHFSVEYERSASYTRDT